MIKNKEIDVRLSDEIIGFIFSKDIKANMSFYGYFLTTINFREVNDNSTAAVYANGSRLYFKYNKAFIDVLSKEEIRFLLMHELSHLLFSHLNRIGDRNMKKSNVVADMIINTSIVEDFDSTFKQIHGVYELTNGKKIKIPKLLIPIEYQGRRIFEELYDWSQIEASKKVNANDSDELKLIKSLFKDIEEGKDVQCTDDHYESSEIEKQIMDSITNDIINGLKNRGYCTQNIEKFLGKLTSDRKNNLNWVLQNLSYVMGSTLKGSWSKPNRYSISGKKGEMLVGHQINVILDVSGSMFGLHEKVLSTIYQNGLQCNIILADTEVKDFIVTKSKTELQNIELKGFGGTELQPAIEYIKNKKEISKINTLILTDGYCDNLDFNGLPGKKMIITTDVLVNYVGSNVKQQKLEI